MSLRNRRLFNCRSCGHNMRLGATECGSCYQPAPQINRLPLPLLLGLPLAALVAVAMWASAH
uniref:Uncharacterized protein n=1 Tax=Alloyangia mangrovi TaxID=1779329 RepID=A0A2A3JYA9_9RHOB